MVYRNKKSYISKDPDKRNKQLRNLKHSGKTLTPQSGEPSKFSQKCLRDMDIITFATEALGISFQERPAQEVVLRALYGLPLTDEQVEIYHKITGGDTNKVYEQVEKTEAVWSVGARGGKSLLVSVIALYESICRAHKWRKYLQKNEIGYCVVIATRQTQAEQIIQANCGRLLENSKVGYLVEDSFQAELTLKNGMRIASMPCSSTSSRGLPIFCLIFDEIAHYRIEGVKADERIYSSLRPRMAQFPGAKCCKISTPAAKQGLFFDEFDEGFAVPGRLTVQCSTRTLNPTIPQEFIDKEYLRDPDNAAREFGAEFAEQVSGFFASCIDALKDCFTLPANTDTPYDPANKYFAGVDQSGLTVTGDRFAFAISHKDRKQDKILADVCRTWRTKDLDLIMAEIASYCKTYKIREVVIDKYAKGYLESSFEAKGLSVVVRELLPAVYTSFKILVNSGKLALPDHKMLRTGLMMTQAYYGKSNSLSIGHERTIHGHGDLADAVVTACAEASKNRTFYQVLTPDELRRQREQEQRRKDEYNPLYWGLE